MAKKFPMGVRFHPSDEEKMSYLLHEVTGQPLPSSDFISTDDLYGEKEPWEIFGDSEETERHFFTKLKKIGKKTSTDYLRFSRNVGNGTWSNKGQKTPIYGRRKQVIGYKRCFRYERKKGNVDQNGKWLLKEYVLPDKVNGKECTDCALCVLKKKGCGKEIKGFVDNDQLDKDTPDVESLVVRKEIDTVESKNDCSSHDVNLPDDFSKIPPYRLEEKDVDSYIEELLELDSSMLMIF